VAGFVASPLAIGSQIGEEVNRRQSQAKVDAARAEVQAQEEVNRATLEFEALNARTLTESIQLHTANAEQLGAASRLSTLLTQQSEETNRPIAERNELLRLALGIQDALNAGAAQEAETRERIAQAQAAQQSANVAALAAAPGLGTDTPASILERGVELQRLSAIIKDQTLPLEERNLAAAQFNQLVQGAEAPLERQRQEALAIAEAWEAVRHTAAEVIATAVAAVQQANAGLAPDNFQQLIQRQREQAAQAAQSGAEAFRVDPSISAGFDAARAECQGRRGLLG
jgi:hypothetical protein